MPLIVLITQDSYLFQGLKHCISLEHIEDLAKVETSHRECVVLIDSRMPMYALQRGWRVVSTLFELTKAIVLCMDDPTILPMSANPAAYTVDMKTSPVNMTPTILDKTAVLMPDKWSQRVRIEINENEMALINAFLRGEEIGEIAKMFYCSQKQVYKLRDKVCQRLHVSHFNIACMYIFRHGLMQRSYSLPETWLRY